MTVERWLAVVKPIAYKSVKMRHTLYSVLLVWFFGPAVNVTTLFRAEFANSSCRWTKISVANDVLALMDFTLQSLLPFSVIIMLYCHIYFSIKHGRRLVTNKDVQLKRITIVAVLACSALILGWFPGRITFMLTKFGHLDANGKINITCVMITFLNSCVNPFLYGIYSPAFRKEYKNFFRKAITNCYKTDNDNASSYPKYADVCRCFSVPKVHSVVSNVNIRREKGFI